MASPLPIDDRASVRWCPSCLSIYRAAFARCPIDGAVLELGSDPLIGQTIAQHYVIDEFLGEGAMARVYRAHHSLLAQKKFAIKIMIGDLAATLEMRLRFAQEADAASQLEHPSVVSVVDFGRSESGLMFIAMELVDGRSLANVISREGALPVRRVLALTRQICQGLAHAHERGLVHRDLKPDNIVITGRDRVRIVDFGLAIPMDDERSTRLTGAGLAMGTPIYAAPEQTCAEPVDHRADLFALGVTMFEMLAGRPPYDGGLVEIIAQNASDGMPSISERAGKRIPPALEDIVRRLMRRDPVDRFADAHAVLAALDAAQLFPSRLVSRPMAPIPQRRWPGTLLGFALFAGLAGVGRLAWITDAPPPPPAESATIEARVGVEEPSMRVAAVAAEDEPPAPVVEEPTKRTPRRSRVASKPTAVRESRAVPAKRPASSNRRVRDEEFHGGPTGFAKLPDPVNPEAAKAAAESALAPESAPAGGAPATDTPF